MLLTSVDADGTQAGYDLEFTRAISRAVSIPVIASGGAGTLEHLYDGVAEGGATTLFAASIFHFCLEIMIVTWKNLGRACGYLNWQPFVVEKKKERILSSAL